MAEEILFDARPVIDLMFSPNSTLKYEKTEKPRVLKFKGGNVFSLIYSDQALMLWTS